MKRLVERTAAKGGVVVEYRCPLALWDRYVRVRCEGDPDRVESSVIGLITRAVGIGYRGTPRGALSGEGKVLRVRMPKRLRDAFLVRHCQKQPMREALCAMMAEECDLYTAP